MCKSCANGGKPIAATWWRAMRGKFWPVEVQRAVRQVGSC